jgi:hypothetical protein
MLCLNCGNEKRSPPRDFARARTNVRSTDSDSITKRIDSCRDSDLPGL